MDFAGAYPLDAQWAVRNAPMVAPAPAQPRVGPMPPAPWDIATGVASSRHGIPGNWNEVHPYERATRATDGAADVGVGRYTNSEGRESVYAGLTGESGPLWWEAGGATGYSGAPVVPFGRIGMRLSPLARLFLAPAMNVDTGDIGPVAGVEVDSIRW